MASAKIDRFYSKINSDLSTSSGQRIKSSCTLLAGQTFDPTRLCPMNQCNGIITINPSSQNISRAAIGQSNCFQLVTAANTEAEYLSYMSMLTMVPSDERKALVFIQERVNMVGWDLCRHAGFEPVLFFEKDLSTGMYYSSQSNSVSNPLSIVSTKDFCAEKRSQIKVGVLGGRPYIIQASNTEIYGADWDALTIIGQELGVKVNAEPGQSYNGFLGQV